MAQLTPRSFPVDLNNEVERPLTEARLKQDWEHVSLVLCLRNELSWLIAVNESQHNEQGCSNIKLLLYDITSVTWDVVDVY